MLAGMRRSMSARCWKPRSWPSREYGSELHCAMATQCEPGIGFRAALADAGKIVAAMVMPKRGSVVVMRSTARRRVSPAMICDGKRRVGRTLLPWGTHKQRRKSDRSSGSLKIRENGRPGSPTIRSWPLLPNVGEPKDGDRTGNFGAGSSREPHSPVTVFGVGAMGVCSAEEMLAGLPDCVSTVRLWTRLPRVFVSSVASAGLLDPDEEEQAGSWHGEVSSDAGMAEDKEPEEENRKMKREKKMKKENFVFGCSQKPASCGRRVRREGQQAASTVVSPSALVGRTEGGVLVGGVAGNGCTLYCTENVNGVAVTVPCSILLYNRSWDDKWGERTAACCKWRPIHLLPHWDHSSQGPSAGSCTETQLETLAHGLLPEFY